MPMLLMVMMVTSSMLLQPMKKVVAVLRLIFVRKAVCYVMVHEFRSKKNSMGKWS